MGGPARWLRVGLALGALVLGGAEAGATREPIAREYQVKAAFLVNFVQFVDWPSRAFVDDTTPLCIGVLGEDPFGSALDDLVRGEKADDRALVVRRATAPEPLLDCHLVFVSESEKDRLGGILSVLEGHPILTVGETDGFSRRGGIINLRIHQNRVRFEINPTAGERQGLKLNSQLLSLGMLVDSGR
jgi:hypothetical protein